VADVDLSGKVALISGGSRGLGREMVLAFAEDCADVIIASRKLDNCEKLANEVSERFGRRALPVAANVGVWDQCDALTEAAYAEFGTVDIRSVVRQGFQHQPQGPVPVVGGAQTALGRIGDPNEIVGAALYFASDESSYTTGSILRVDGGMK